MSDMTQLAEVVAEAIKALPISDEVRIDIGVSDEGAVTSILIRAIPPAREEPAPIGPYAPPVWVPSDPILGGGVTYCSEGGDSP